MNRCLRTCLDVAFLALYAKAVLGADERFLWRSWGVRDGFAKTYSRTISWSPEGGALVRHGAVGFMSQFDGYEVVPILDPRGSAPPIWEATRRVYQAPQGSLWTATLDALLEYLDGRWIVRYRPPPGRKVLDAVPAGAHVMVLLEDRVLALDPRQNVWREVRSSGTSAIVPFVSMGSGAVSELVITGEHGMARLGRALKGDVWNWQEISGGPEQLTDFDYPMPGKGEVFAQATLRGGRHAVIRWAGSQLQRVYESDATKLRAWRT